MELSELKTIAPEQLLARLGNPMPRPVEPLIEEAEASGLFTGSNAAPSVDPGTPKTIGEIVSNRDAFRASVLKILRVDSGESSWDLWQRVESVGDEVASLGLPQEGGAWEVATEKLKTALAGRAALAAYDEMKEQAPTTAQLEDLGEMLQAHGGAEYLTAEELRVIGLDAADFDNVGTKVAKEEDPKPTN